MSNTRAKLIYGCADVAAHFDVGRSTVAMWLARYSDTPAPAYVTSDGRAFWSDMAAWQRWQASRSETIVS